MTDVEIMWGGPRTNEMALNSFRELKPCSQCEHHWPEVDWCKRSWARDQVIRRCADERKPSRWWNIRDWFHDRCGPKGLYFAWPNLTGTVTFRRPSPFTLPEVRP